MDLPHPELTLEELKRYRIHAQQRYQSEANNRIRRAVAAWSVARQVASMLRQDFGATRTVIFGSLLREECFTPWSDIDIAVWGLSYKDTFRAISAAQMISTEFEINLVDIATASASLRLEIEANGMDL